MVAGEQRFQLPQLGEDAAALGAEAGEEKFGITFLLRKRTLLLLPGCLRLPLSMSLTPRAERWLTMAEDARRMADCMDDPDAKRVMVEIADSYDRLAAWPTVHTGDPHIIAASRYTQQTERLRIYDIPGIT